MTSDPPAEQSSAGPPVADVLDKAALAEHVRLLGPACVAEIVGKLLDSAPETGELVARAARDGDMSTLAAQAHKLGSGAVTLGLPALNETVRSVERLARAGRADAAVAAAALVPPVLEETLAALAAYRRGLQE